MEKTKREKIMKTEQIELAIAIYEYGSITKAAQNCLSRNRMQVVLYIL